MLYTTHFTVANVYTCIRIVRASYRDVNCFKAVVCSAA